MITELPTWETCQIAVDNDHATALEKFIHSYEPTSNDEEWRQDLMHLLNNPHD